MVNKIKNSLIAIVLSVVMFSYAVPTTVWKVLADELFNISQSERTVFDKIIKGNLVDKCNVGDAYIVKENVKNRTLDTKEFLMNDGSLMIQQFAEPIHYEENGKYKEIDNTLVEKTTDNKNVVYENSSNSFKVKFNKETKKDEAILSIAEEGYSFSVGYNKKDYKQIKAELEDSNKKEKVNYKNEKLKKPKNNNSAIGKLNYDEIEEGINFSFQVENKRLIENIIINKKQTNYSYTFTLNSSNLHFEIDKEGNLIAANNFDKEKFILKAPSLIDANGQYCDKIKYAVNSNMKTELTIVADSEWINQTANLPITISQIIESKSDKNIEFANVYDDGTMKITDKYAYAGSKDGIKKSDLFMNIKLPEAKQHYKLMGAKVLFDYQTQGTRGTDINDCQVYVVESQDVLGKINNENKPDKIQALSSISETKEKFSTYESENINVKKINNNTITIQIENKNEALSETYVEIPIALSSAVSTVTYYEITSGIKDDYSMETAEIDGATAYINNASGDLTLACDLLSINTLTNMPFKLSLIYNSNYSELLAEFGKSTSVGSGFKLNFQQYLINEDGVYYLIDADGSLSTFFPVSSGEYYSKDSQLYYKPSAKMIYDLTGNKMYFANGLLTKIVSDNDETEYIKINYQTGTENILNIQYFFNSTAKYSAEFVYSDSLNNNISSVTLKHGTVTINSRYLEYQNGRLVAVKTGENDSAVKIFKFGYSTTYSSMLDKVFNNLKQGLIFSVSSGKISFVNIAQGQIEDISEMRMYEKFDFYYDDAETEITHIKNGIEKEKKHVAFNNSNHAISKWVEDERGIVSVSNKINWSSNEDILGDQYNDGWYSYVQNTSGSKFIGLTSLSSSQVKLLPEISVTNPSSDVYKYAVCFKAWSDEALDFSVTIGGSSTTNVYLTNGGETYISIPWQYCATTLNVVFRNNSSTGGLTIDDLFYGIVDATTTEYQKNGLNMYEKESTVSQLLSGTRIIYSYDDKQRVSSAQTKAANDEIIETTTYSYFIDGVGNGSLSSAVTKNQNNITTESVEYSYLGSNSSYNLVETYIKGSLSQQSITSVDLSVYPYVVSETDINNNSTVYYYQLMSGDIRLSKSENNNKRTQYTYDAYGNITSINVYDMTTSINLYSQTDTYDANGIFVETTGYGGTYSYEYEQTGLLSNINFSVNGQGDQKLSYTYKNNAASYGCNQLDSKTYANGNVVNYSYTEGSVRIEHKTDSSYSIGEEYVYCLDNKGNVTSQYHRKNSSYIDVQYTYDGLSDPKTDKLSINYLSHFLSYNKNYDVQYNRIASIDVVSYQNCSFKQLYTIDYGYNEEGYVSKMEYEEFKSEYEYDDLGRLTTRDLSYGYYPVKEEEYTYNTLVRNGKVYQTNRLSRIRYTDKEDEADKTTTYDANGNIRSISYNGDNYIYEYDSFGRLIRETTGNSTKTYSYDSYNNIQVAGLTYTNGQLTSVNGSRVVYDDMGNPEIYKGNVFYWEQGRKLVSGRINNKDFRYKYDGNGMRYFKEVDHKQTEYYWDGDQLLMEISLLGVGKIFYIYDATGISGMMIYDDVYYFDKNTLGDIVAIRDAYGGVLARYEYDAWGNHKVYDADGIEETSEYFIGNINPFRYRGYYFDKETGFYYLQSRYYDPVTMRFINADNYELVSILSTIPGQLNMYTYCNNNPIMYIDKSGEGIFFVLFLTTFTVVGASVGLGVGLSQGDEGWQLVGDIALGAAAGLLTGSLTASIFGAYGVVSGKALILGMKPISTWALGSAIYDLLGLTIAPILRIEFVPIEYDGGKDYDMLDNMPPSINRPYSTYVIGDYYG